VLAGLALLLAAPLARAAPGDATRLSYARTAAAAACPDREAVRAAVARRLGYDPFFPVARQSIEVDIDADATQLTANMRFIDEDGMIVGVRQLHEQLGNCDELVASLSLAISITLDPSAALEGPRREAPVSNETGPDAPPEPAQASPEAATEASPEAAEEPSPEPRRAAKSQKASPPLALRPGAERRSQSWEALLRLQALLALGRLPSTAFGARLAAGVRGGALSGALEVSGFLPTSKDSPRGGRARASSISAAAVPCYASERVAACAIVDVGIIDARGVDVSEPQHQRELYAAVGGRAELKQPLTMHWALILGAELLKNLSPLELRLHDATVWQAPAWSGALALGVELKIP
jgi:hypothetical protein